MEANVQGTSVQQDEQHPLVYFKLPDDIADRHVLVMDPILSSGYTVVRAIETLLVRSPAHAIKLPVCATSAVCRRDAYAGGLSCGQLRASVV